MSASMTAEERDAFWRKNRGLADQIARSGTPIFPCTPDKKPTVKSWQTAASTDSLKINNWWAGGKQLIPGIPTGKKTGFFVLDVDRPKAPGEPDGLDTLRDLEAKYGPLPETLRQRTPSGGIHYIFMMPNDGRDIRNSSGQIGPKLDIRGSGGYICGYGLENENEVEVADPPPWLLELIFAKKQTSHSAPATKAAPRPNGKLHPYIQAAIDGELEQAATASKGTRNHTLNRAAFALGQWAGGGHLSFDEGFNMLMQAATTSGVFYDDGEPQTRKTIDSGLRSGMATPRHPPEPEKKAPSAKKAEPKTDKPKGGGEVERPVIKWDESRIHVIIEEVIDVLVDKWRRRETPVIFRRPEGVVRIGKVERNSQASRLKVKRDADAMMLYQVEPAWLHAYLTEIIAWEKYNLKTGWNPSSCPKKIVELFLAKRGELRIPFLSGIINAPTMRPDGTILDKPGYDEATGLFFDPCGIDWPKVPDNPTWKDALPACDLLLDLVSEFPFKTDAGRSVALAYFLTCLVRRILPKAPGFGFSATMQGTGKTYLGNAGSLLATGCDADLMAPPEDEAEMRKCLTALLMEGASVIVIDNVMRTFFSVNLCAILTSSTFKGRILGQSKTPSVSTNTTIAVTGNHLTFKGDTTRRFLLCDLDAQTEKPEEREFKRDLEAHIKEHRAEIVTAGLTILRAYFLAPNKPKLKPYGSFEEWSFLVRGALVWCSQPDPYESKAEIEENDPVREGHILVIEAWRKTFKDTPVKIEDALDPEQGTQELVDALNMAVSFKGKKLTPRDVGYWLRNKDGVFINGMCFKKAGGNTKARKFKVMVR